MRYCLLLSLLTLPVVGCGLSTNASTVPTVNTVSGTVTYQQKTLEYGIITFIQSDGRKLKSIIDRQGRYSISGIKDGVVKIVVDSSLFPEGLSSGRTDKNTFPTRLSLPEQYASESMTPLSFTVAPGAQEHHLVLEKMP
ncbi:MAG TPA: hypothetical protein PLN21_21530 [Gemmatales bacterium]|nr:hypothetical protein [Gemmatales bacterium]